MNRRTAALALSLLVVAVGSCKKGGGRPPAATHVALAGDLAITGATVVPMDREGALPGHTVLIRGDRIVAVAPDAEVDAAGAKAIDAKGKWVVPGLADMHVHFWNERDLDMFALNGVTTVRNLFGSPEHVRWRDEIAAGKRTGPVIVSAGPIIDGDPPVWPGSAVATTPAAARTIVNEQKAAGYDWLKVYNGLSAEVHAAVIDEAKKVGLPVGGHVPKAVGVLGVIASGQKTIEHLDGYVPFFGDPPAEPTVEATVKAGVWNCPTLVVTDRFGRMDKPDQLAATRGLELVTPAVRAMWDPSRDFRLQRFTPEMFAAVRAKNELRRRLVGELNAAGAKLVLGTDTGNPFVVPGFAVADELQLLVASGLTPWQALRTATVNAAELVGTPGAFGVIAPGARADLVIVEKDPLADIGALADPPFVVLRGVHHERGALQARLAEPGASAADRLAALPPLAPEGREIARATYELLMFDQVIGAERLVASLRGSGDLVIQGDQIYVAPQAMTTSYRSTPDELELTADNLVPPAVKVSRRGTTVVAVQEGKPPLEKDFPAGAVITPQTVAELMWYVTALTVLEVGEKAQVTAAEVRTDSGLALDPGAFTFTRVADVAGKRTYDLTGKVGDLDVTGRLTLDADGVPAEVVFTVKFGTFTSRRLPAAAGG